MEWLLNSLKIPSLILGILRLVCLCFFLHRWIDFCLNKSRSFFVYFKIVFEPVLGEVFANCTKQTSSMTPWFQELLAVTCKNVVNSVTSNCNQLPFGSLLQIPLIACKPDPVLQYRSENLNKPEERLNFFHLSS